MPEPALHPPLAGAGRRPGWRFLLAHPAHWIALGFGSGLSPVAPGHRGDALRLARLRPARSPRSATARAARSSLAAIAASAGGPCTVTARHLDQADPSAIVWDEIVAFWLVLWLVTPASFVAQAVAFVLFRFFDAAKPGPVAWADQRFKRRRGAPIGWAQGFGILLRRSRRRAVHAGRDRALAVRVSDAETPSPSSSRASPPRCAARGATMAAAESCTGGLIAAACTSRAGSSEWFERGVVTYSNAAKSELLGVAPALIAAHGAVSAEVARAMAEGALARSPARFAVAVTGIAGPGRRHAGQAGRHGLDRDRSARRRCRGDACCRRAATAPRCASDRSRVRSSCCSRVSRPCRLAPA